uniref:Mitochondrial import receptor subunit TOM40 homolog n=1 Tax=Plectus sambesii TaxID=2011161 RepID=A0A914W0M2_9BILA
MAQSEPASSMAAGQPPPPPPLLTNVVAQNNNPGSYDELHRKCKDVFPMCFEGAKAMLQKGLSSHFQISHTVSISPMNTGYRFGATYVGTKQVGPQESFPVLLGDTDVNGNTSATLIHQFGERWRCKVQSQVQGGKFAAWQGTGEYRGRMSTLGLTVANPDIISESGIVVGQYLRRVLPQLDLGAELVYQYGKQVPGGHFSMLSYAARYNGANFIATGTISGSSALHLCYYHKQTQNLSFGVEWELSRRGGQEESVATFGYQIEMPEDGVTLRASADTNWTVGGVFEKRLHQNMPFTLALSGMLNHVKAVGKFGIGLIVG